MPNLDNFLHLYYEHRSQSLSLVSLFCVFSGPKSAPKVIISFQHGGSAKPGKAGFVLRFQCPGYDVPVKSFIHLLAWFPMELIISAVVGLGAAMWV